jgi:hypothetical protein
MVRVSAGLGLNLARLVCQGNYFASTALLLLRFYVTAESLLNGH